MSMIDKASIVVLTSVPFGHGNIQNLERPDKHWKWHSNVCHRWTANWKKRLHSRKGNNTASGAKKPRSLICKECTWIVGHAQCLRKETGACARRPKTSFWPFEIKRRIAWMQLLLWPNNWRFRCVLSSCNDLGNLRGFCFSTKPKHIIIGARVQNTVELRLVWLKRWPRKKSKNSRKWYKKKHQANQWRRS